MAALKLSPTTSVTLNLVKYSPSDIRIISITVGIPTAGGVNLLVRTKHTKTDLFLGNRYMLLIEFKLLMLSQNFVMFIFQ